MTLFLTKLDAKKTHSRNTSLFMVQWLITKEIKAPKGTMNSRMYISALVPFLGGEKGRSMTTRRLRVNFFTHQVPRFGCTLERNTLVALQRSLSQGAKCSFLSTTPKVYALPECKTVLNDPQGWIFLLILQFPAPSTGSLRWDGVDGSENVSWKCNCAF